MNYTFPGDEGKTYADAGGYTIYLPKERDIAEILVDNIYNEDWHYHSVLFILCNNNLGWINFD